MEPGGIGNHGSRPNLYDEKIIEGILTPEDRRTGGTMPRFGTERKPYRTKATTSTATTVAVLAATVVSTAERASAIGTQGLCLGRRERGT